MKTYDVLFEYRMQGEDSTSYDTRTVSIEIKATDSIDATDKLRNAFQQLVDSDVGRIWLTWGQAALHWVVRGVLVCIDCWNKEKHPTWVRPSDPVRTGRTHVSMARDAGPPRDEFIRALKNALDAYDRQLTRPASPGGALHAAYELDKMHVAEARKLLALVKP